MGEDVIGGRCPSWQAMVSVKNFHRSARARPPPADTPDESSAVTTSQVTPSIQDFAVSLDLDGRCVRIVETVYEFGQLVKGTPKSEASKRKTTLPELIMPELRRHLERVHLFDKYEYLLISS